MVLTPVHTWTGGLVCNEPFFMSHYTSVITQRNGLSPLMKAAREGMTDIVRLLLKAGANIHLLTEVHTYYQ